MVAVDIYVYSKEQEYDEGTEEVNKQCKEKWDGGKILHATTVVREESESHHYQKQEVGGSRNCTVCIDKGRSKNGKENEKESDLF